MPFSTTAAVSSLISLSRPVFLVSRLHPKYSSIRYTSSSSSSSSAAAPTAPIVLPSSFPVRSQPGSEPTTPTAAPTGEVDIFSLLGEQKRQACPRLPLIPTGRQVDAEWANRVLRRQQAEEVKRLVEEGVKDALEKMGRGPPPP